MIWIIVSSIVTAAFSIWAGYRRVLYLYQIDLRRLLLSALIAVSIYSLMLFLFKIEILSEETAGAIISNVYASVFGFFTGAAMDQYRTRKNAGSIIYVHRTFISEYLPVIISLALILFGIHRTSLFLDIPVTPIRFTSGLSIISTGLWGLTLRLVPEFRSKGIVLLDTIVDWKHLLSYRWFEENILEIDYEKEESIRSFKTLIPAEDELIVETFMSDKMREKLEEDEET